MSSSTSAEWQPSFKQKVGKKKLREDHGAFDVDDPNPTNIIGNADDDANDDMCVQLDDDQSVKYSNLQVLPFLEGAFLFLVLFHLDFKR